MMRVVFENDGELDVRSIKTFGVSVKEGKNPIGFFGTGMKYAIAILAREGCEVEIHVGKDKYIIQSKSIQIRNKPIEIITMNGEELPFTTHLGSNWELWQAFREFYCNCKDEAGEVRLISEPVEPEENKTRFIIKGSEFVDIFHEKDTIILNLPNSPMERAKGLEIYDCPNNFLYYRGIRVAPLNKPSLFTYNMISETTLTEDRTVKFMSTFKDLIQDGTAKLKDKNWIYKILMAPKEHWERDFYYAGLKFAPEGAISDEFHEVLAKLFTTNKDGANKTALEYYKDRQRKDSIKSFEYVELDAIEQQQMDRAVAICQKLFPDFIDFDLKTVKTLGESTMAMALTDLDCMIVSKKCFRFGTKFLVSTLIEEYAHLKSGFGDCTRELQTYLFDTICTFTEKYVIHEPI